MSRRAWLVVAVVVIIGYWTTGRMDPALSSVGLNYTNCIQIMGTTMCGDQAYDAKNRLNDALQSTGR